MTVKLYRNFSKSWEVPFQQWNFPGGEVGVKLNHEDIHIDEVYTIAVKGIPSSKDIFIALNLCDAVFNIVQDKFKVTLQLDYFPYARQDRVCNNGESFALKVFVNMLVAQDSFGYLEVLDLHSEVTKKLFTKEQNLLFVKECNYNLVEISDQITIILFIPMMGRQKKHILMKQTV